MHESPKHMPAVVTNAMILRKNRGTNSDGNRYLYDVCPDPSDNNSRIVFNTGFVAISGIADATDNLYPGEKGADTKFRIPTASVVSSFVKV